MGAIQLPDAVQRVIDRQIAEGRATSAEAFLEEAVLRLADAMQAEEHDLRDAAEAGMTDIAVGRFTTIASPEEERLLRERVLARLRDRFGG